MIEIKNITVDNDGFIRISTKSKTYLVKPDIVVHDDSDQDKLHSLMRRAYAHHKEWSGFMRQMSYYLIDYKNRQHLPQYKKQEDD